MPLVDERLEDVERLAARVGAAVGDLGVDDGVEAAPVGPHAAAGAERERMGELPDAGDSR